MEQLNIEGKRSGQGFVCHRARLIEALARAQAPLVEIIGLTLGRKGFANYLRLLGGSDFVKVVPSNGVAGDEQDTLNRLKVVCGPNTSYLDDKAWVAEGIKHSNCCEVRVSPHNVVTPNLGGIELAEALSRVLPFCAPKKDERMALKCVRFAQNGNLTLTASDGFRLAEQSLDFEGEESEVLVLAHAIKGMTSALKKAKRVNLSIEQRPEALDRKALVIQTEAIGYRFDGYSAKYPDYTKAIPSDFVAEATVDTREMLKAAASLGALSLDKETAVIISVGDGRVRLYVKDDRGEAQVQAEAEGEAEIAINSVYLTQALRSLGGMARMQIKSPDSPMVFSSDGYRLVQTPLMIGLGKKNGEGDAQDIPPQQAEGERAEAEPQQPEGEAEQVAEPVAETQPEKPKRKRRSKAPVAVQAR